jgi:hypothetical protein
MITKKDFTNQVELMLIRGRGVGIMDAILRVCEDNKIEPESAKRLLSQPLKEKLEAEAQKLRLIDRGMSSRATITSFFED